MQKIEIKLIKAKELIKTLRKQNKRLKKKIMKIKITT